MLSNFNSIADYNYLNIKFMSCEYYDQYNNYHFFLKKYINLQSSAHFIIHVITFSRISGYSVFNNSINNGIPPTNLISVLHPTIIHLKNILLYCYVFDYYGVK